MEIERIHIWDFPKEMYIELPDQYRETLFKLVLHELKSFSNVKKTLRENNLKTNIQHWKEGKDGIMKQLINLESLLFLIPYVEERKNNIMKVYIDVKNSTNLSEKRIEKNKIILILLREIRDFKGGYNKISKILDINSGTLRSYVNSSKIKKLPQKILKIILEIIEREIICYSFSKEEIEEKIISYKVFHGKVIFPVFEGERKLPIDVTPEFESVFYHMMGDGHVGKGTSEYTQINTLNKNNFLYKLFRIFGKFNYSKKGLKCGRVYIPKTIMTIICKYYNFNHTDFKWDKSSIPKKCLNRNDPFKLSGLISFIVDEGYVGKSVITLHLSNKILLNQIRKITQDLDIGCGDVRIKKGRGTTKDSFRFNIFKQGVKKLSVMSNELELLYPTCSLVNKKEKMIRILNRDTLTYKGHLADNQISF